MTCKTKLFIFSGDTILYKRNDSNEWRGLGIVIGQINQQVFVKHGSFFVRIHPCRLQFVKLAYRAVERNDPSGEKMDKSNTTWIHNENHYETSSDSEDEGQERNQQRRPLLSTLNSNLQLMETNHPPLATSSDPKEKPTEIKHQ